MNETIDKLVKGVMDKRNKHLSNWIKKHLEIIGMDASKSLFKGVRIDKDILTSFDFQEELKCVYGFEHMIKAVTLLNDIEEHRILLHGKQIGTTLFIRHNMVSSTKVELHIREELAPDLHEILDGES